MVKAQLSPVIPIPDTTFGNGTGAYFCDRTVGGDSLDMLKCIIELSDKQLIIGGTSNSENSVITEFTDYSKGNGDYWVAMLNPTGTTVLWNKAYGGNNIDSLSTIIRTSDGFLIGGSSKSSISGNKTDTCRGEFDFWILNIALNGDILWQKTYGGNKNDFLTTIQPASNNEYYLAGYSNSDGFLDKTDTCRGGYDYWIIKIDNNGNKIWDKTIGGNQDDILQDLCVSYFDTLICAGYSISDISGEKTAIPYGNYDYWIVSLTSTGDKINDAVFGGSSDDFLYGIEETIDTSGFVLAGSSRSGANGSKTEGQIGSFDYWCVKSDYFFNKIWDETLGGTGLDYMQDMIHTPEGGFVFAGYSDSDIGYDKTEDSRGELDYWIIKIDSITTTEWDKTYGGNNTDKQYCITQSCDRGFLLGGTSNSPISGDKSENTRGLFDYWLLKISVPTNPYFTFSGTCLGETTGFLDISETIADSWQWTFGDALSGANTATDQKPTHTYSETGDYNVTLIVKEGCRPSDTVTRTVTIKPNPILGKVDLGEDVCIEQGKYVWLNAGQEIPYGSKYYWYPTGDTTQTLYVDSVAIYSVTVVATNGCAISDEIIVAQCPDIFIPNAFTPFNGDNTNQVFYIIGNNITEFDWKVYNRWGQVIFHTTDINEGWDGTYLNKPVQIGVYPYVVTYTGIGVKPKRKIGHINLIR